MITLEQLDAEIAAVVERKSHVKRDAEIALLQLDAVEQTLQLLALPLRKAQNMGGSLATEQIEPEESGKSQLTTLPC